MFDEGIKVVAFVERVWFAQRLRKRVLAVQCVKARQVFSVHEPENCRRQLFYRMTGFSSEARTRE